MTAFVLFLVSWLVFAGAWALELTTNPTFSVFWIKTASLVSAIWFSLYCIFWLPFKRHEEQEERHKKQIQEIQTSHNSKVSDLEERIKALESGDLKPVNLAPLELKKRKQNPDDED